MITRQALITASLTAAFSAVTIPALQVAPLYTATVNVIPLIHSGKVMVQDFSQGTYRFKTIDAMTGSAADIRNNQSSYLHPCDFGGSHVAWISYTTSTGGGGGGGIYPGLSKASGPGLPVPIPGSSARYYVKVFKVSSASEQNATADTTYKEQIAIDKGRVVWTDYRHFASGDTTIELYYFDAAGGTEKRITNRKGYKSAPHIRGDKIVWQDYRNAGSTKNADIYLYDLATSTEKAICTNSSYQDQPCIYGNYVVWQDYRNAGSNPKNADIYLYDLSKNQERAICTAPGYQCNPRIFGNIIVWQDYRNAQADTSNADIYLFDLSKNTETALITKPGYQSFPAVYDDVVTWYDYTDNKAYVARLSVGVLNGVPALRGRTSAGIEMRLFFDARKERFDLFSIVGRRSSGIGTGCRLYITK